jgi:hypothetical protein
MSIERIVEQALQDGYLTPAMEAEVGRICDTASELSIEEYMALDRLMGALRSPVSPRSNPIVIAPWIWATLRLMPSIVYRLCMPQLRKVPTINEAEPKTNCKT